MYNPIQELQYYIETGIELATNSPFFEKCKTHYNKKQEDLIEIYDSLGRSKADTIQLINEVQSQLKIEGLILSFVLAVYAKLRGAIQNSDIIKVLAPILDKKNV